MLQGDISLSLQRKDKEGETMSFLDKLLQYFEKEAASIDAQFLTDPQGDASPGSNNFTSCIKFDGKPILPPLVSSCWKMNEEICWIFPFDLCQVIHSKP